MTMHIIFLIDTNAIQQAPGGQFGNPANYPKGHPPLKYGRGDNPNAYTNQSGDTPVVVAFNEEVLISVQDSNSGINVACAPVGLVAMTWQGNPVTLDNLTGGDAVIGDISFRDDRTDLYDYNYVVGSNSPWSPDNENDNYLVTRHDANLLSPVKRNPYIVIPALTVPGTLQYGLEFYCAIQGTLIGTYWFDPKITISASG
ncbi:hypothetical protein [Sorangium sp. So ce388]|uniref:hypothetical protein n=1 Tax=Sorangium sp. So ce388 TaxID=3133309 RepID=UPI003F5B793F